MKYKYIYLIGIGGIGMSAIARYYNHLGVFTAGYDRTSSSLTVALESEGIAVHYEENVSLIPEVIRNNPQSSLVIYTPAVPESHSEFKYLREKGFKIIKRSQALGTIALDKKTLAVAGTHGKTTTSTLLAHILKESGKGCTAFLGGISVNWKTNLLLDKGDTLVAEADEYDRSFHRLYPHIAVVTSADADHLDIYSTHDKLKEAFEIFISQIEPSGALVIKKDCGLDTGKSGSKKIWNYSYDTPCDCYAKNIRAMERGFSMFDLVYPGGVIRDCTLGVPGWVNVENAVAASAASILYGIDNGLIKKALSTFAGVSRRFEIRVNSDSCVYIDDYAHHPKELSAAISSIRSMFPEKKLTAVFQPHLYSRTRDFAGEFAAALSLVDRLILLDIYPAREEPIPGVSSRTIFKDITAPEKIATSKNNLMELLESIDLELLVTFGAGDIDRFAEPVTQMIKRKYNV
ncbi:MAG: UDP-N-acetylmuramate--L-alanine ligase [Bacteroidales bacterium]|nr:UDP-N-acetylmuramate--L-alanine ligase [Bacteroidales bacterium]MDD3988750.1 UDP-N-acetylmuramate--L-alanine ligase [Bacteroidales bacterium]MDD4638624.1 UDP-N-acetylmuramate--L-alanine ligase [Bacteroidales bacterium]